MFGGGGFGAKPPGTPGLTFGGTSTGFGGGQTTGFGGTPGGGTAFGAPQQTNTGWGANTGTTGLGGLGQPSTGFGAPSTGRSRCHFHYSKYLLDRLL